MSISNRINRKNVSVISNRVITRLATKNTVKEINFSGKKILATEEVDKTALDKNNSLLKENTSLPIESKKTGTNCVGNYKILQTAEVGKTVTDNNNIESKKTETNCVGNCKIHISPISNDLAVHEENTRLSLRVNELTQQRDSLISHSQGLLFKTTHDVESEAMPQISNNATQTDLSFGNDKPDDNMLNLMTIIHMLKKDNLVLEGIIQGLKYDIGNINKCNSCKVRVNQNPTDLDIQTPIINNFDNFPPLYGLKNVSQVPKDKSTTNKISPRTKSLPVTHNVSEDDAICLSNINVIQNKVTQIKKVTLVADSHGRNCSKWLQEKLGEAYMVQVITHPGAPFKYISGSATENCRAFTTDDTIVVMGGANDINENVACVSNLNINELLNKSRNTNIVVIPVPYRYDKPLMNGNIQKTNEALINSVKNESHVKYIDLLNFERSEYTNHGLHLNKKGKIHLCSLIANIIKGNNEEERISKINQIESICNNKQRAFLEI